ncbi:LysM peptidoglycan-binding domain-containing protein [Desulfobacter vibrioformis]|uniref:LysM peptidoglycan-binding domain-containing protein n=1 Tax=Desulfobacter vibrioformis TaxID=34031 RepID=UPI00054D4522|nr:LysM domain-containing protein [Desulfobacter vibrioformis]
MIKNTASESKILTPGKNTNQKKTEPEVSAIGIGGTLLKKNEFTMILVAALVVTVLVFFFFFRGSSTQPAVEHKPVPETGTDQAAPGFERRISALEVSVAKLASSSGQNENQASSQAVSALDERITRIETASTLKLDALIERVEKFEGRLNKLEVAAATPPLKTVVKPQPEVKTPPIPALKKQSQVIKKKAEKPEKTSQFHTVQKGDTLWSISQKYKTSVAAIRKLNNLTPKDDIYPGSNLLVRSR